MFFSVGMEDLEFIPPLANSNGKVHVEATKNVVRVALAVEQSPALVLALLKKKKRSSEDSLV